MHAETNHYLELDWDSDFIDSPCLTPWEYALSMQCMFPARFPVSNAPYMM